MRMSKQFLVILLLSMAGPTRTHAADSPPPPPPNPFSNLPANGSEGFTPFDDDFEDPGMGGGDGAPPSDTAFLNRGGDNRANKGSNKPSQPGSTVEGGKAP